jgi:hypothetical protein
MARRPLLAGSHKGISTTRAVPAHPHLADQVVPETTAQADLETTALADLQASDQADRVVPARGMGMPSAVTSTKLRGATDPRPGALARHHGRTGVGPFRRPVDSG